MSSPKKRIVPEDGGKSPAMQLKSVVLPAPFEPSTARRSPGRTVMVTSVSAASAPNSRVTPRSSSAAPAPTTDRRCATLSMAASIRSGRGGRVAAAPDAGGGDGPVVPARQPAAGAGVEGGEGGARPRGGVDVEAGGGQGGGMVGHALKGEADGGGGEIRNRKKK